MVLENTISIKVREIIVEKYDVKTFVLERTDGESLEYAAGQFLTFLKEINGREVRRSYSMSSAPAVDAYPAITIKRVANGEISRFWLDQVKIGDVFNCLPASGRFVLTPAPATQKDVVLIGAGSGITPLFSILKQVLTEEVGSSVTLLYANRNDGHALFVDQINDWQRRFPDRLRNELL